MSRILKIFLPTIKYICVCVYVYVCIYIVSKSPPPTISGKCHLPLALGTRMVTVMDDTALGEAAWGALGKARLTGAQTAPLWGVKRQETL